MKKPQNRLSVTPTGVHCTQSTAAGLEFAGDRGEVFSVTVLEKDLIRVRMQPQGTMRLDRTWLVLDRNGSMPREGRSRNDLSPFSLPPFEVEENEEQIHLRTGDLHLTIHLSDFALSWHDAAGNVLAADEAGRSYLYEPRGQQIGHYLHNTAGEHYYGFGEVSGKLNKAGSRILLKNIDHPGYNAKNSSPLYKHFPFYITFQPQTGQAFGLFYDNLATTFFDMGKPSGWRSYLAEGGDIDYTFIYGPTIAEVVEKFTRMTGRMVLPPRWSLGYMGSTMNYTEAPDAQRQLAKFAQKCRQYQVPCDLFHLSSGYTLGEDGKRYVFHWNRKRVPNPQEMVDDFHQNGIRLAANIKPALLTTHPRFNEVKGLGAFIREPNSDDPQLFKFWGGTAAALDFTNPIAFDWWKRQVKEQLLDYGIDSTWNDNNEFEVTEENARCMGFGRNLPIGLARPLQTLMMMRASYEAQLEAQPQERPFLISRAGAPGMQRYVQTWSGDNFTSWQTMKYNLPMGLGLGLSGAPNTSHDVGGFAGRRPSPELFMRWVQNNIFHPRFTIHSWKVCSGANEPWMYPSVFPQVLEALRFRYRLIPYLYNLLVEASLTGHPIMRPLIYQFQNDLGCAEESFDFMLGSTLLVASVTTPLARRRKVYLPAGQSWYDFHTYQVLAGGKNHTVPAPREYIPLFVPEGGMIPMGGVIHPLYQVEDNLRQIWIFPHLGIGDSTLDLYEDDGHSLAYMTGERTCVHFKLHSHAEALELEANLTESDYALPYRELEFILPPFEKRSFHLQGLRRQWMDDKQRLHFTCAISAKQGKNNE